MYVLGLAGQLHDAAACIVKDGHVLAAVEEERFVRRKFIGIEQAGGLPRRAIAYCLKEAGTKLTDIDYVGYYYKPWSEFLHFAGFRARRGLHAPGYAAFHLVRLTSLLSSHRLTYELLAQAGVDKRRQRFLRHHLTHAASAFYPSPFDEAAILTVDHNGEWSCTEFNRGEGTRIRGLAQVNFPHSLGFLYSLMTRYLGFDPGSDEYKVMGLASYGEPEYLAHLRRLVQLHADGSYSFRLEHFNRPLRGPYLSSEFLRVIGPTRQPDDPIERRHMNIAASLQQLLEDIALHMAEHLHRLTKSRNLCLAGGVALNCSMNARLLRDSPFDRIWVQPAAGDGGCAVGAALELYHGAPSGRSRIPMEHAYLGPAFDDDAIGQALTMSKTPYLRCAEDELVASTARLIADGRIVGWFQGRMEWGPRALGSRSILADATRPDMKDLLNRCVKHREDFRPFAPSVVSEAATQYFDCGSQPESPFMLFVQPVRAEARSRIPAVTHVDGTARIQTVERRHNPRYWNLLKEVERLRGVPLIVNTSFNVQGEPIVCTPEDALRCFYSTGLDALAIGNFLVCKDGAVRAAVARADASTS